MRTKCLTVMVSMYKSGQWIQNRIKNLLECGNDIEIWCVNANSPDTRDHEIPQKFPVKYIKLPERITVYETWNYIIKNSNSKYITQANTDDIVAPNCYQELIKALDERPNFDFSYCNWYAARKPNQTWQELTKKGDNRPGQYDGSIDVRSVGHFPLWRRSLHSKFGYFDTKFRALADADWWARCYWTGNTKFFWVDKTLACYLWREGNNLWHKEITPEEWNIYHQKVNAYKTAK